VHCLWSSSSRIGGTAFRMQKNIPSSLVDLMTIDEDEIRVVPPPDPEIEEAVAEYSMVDSGSRVRTGAMGFARHIHMERESMMSQFPMGKEKERLENYSNQTHQGIERRDKTRQLSLT
jgi:hypothetical protein